MRTSSTLYRRVVPSTRDPRTIKDVRRPTSARTLPETRPRRRCRGDGDPARRSHRRTARGRARPAPTHADRLLGSGSGPSSLTFSPWTISSPASQLASDRNDCHAVCGDCGVAMSGQSDEPVSIIRSDVSRGDDRRADAHRCHQGRPGRVATPARPRPTRQAPSAAVPEAPPTPPRAGVRRRSCPRNVTGDRNLPSRCRDAATTRRLRDLSRSVSVQTRSPTVRRGPASVPTSSRSPGSLLRLRRVASERKT